MTMSILQDDNNNEMKKHTTYHYNLQLHITYGANYAIFTYARRSIPLFK